MLLTFHQQSLIQPDTSHYLLTAHYQGYCLNDVIQITGRPNYMLPNREFRGKEYLGRSSQMIGVADDGTLILELYPLDNLLAEQDQMNSEHPQPQIVYVAHKLSAVVHQVSICNFFQLTGVDDPKQD